MEAPTAPSPLRGRDQSTGAWVSFTSQAGGCPRAVQRCVGHHGWSAGSGQASGWRGARSVALRAVPLCGCHRVWCCAREHYLCECTVRAKGFAGWRPESPPCRPPVRVALVTAAWGGAVGGVRTQCQSSSLNGVSAFGPRARTWRSDDGCTPASQVAPSLSQPPRGLNRAPGGLCGSSERSGSRRPRGSGPTFQLHFTPCP